MATSGYMRIIRNRVLLAHGLNMDDFYRLPCEVRTVLLHGEDEKFRKAVITRYGSYARYQEHLAKEHGFNTYREYFRERLKDRGFESVGDYEHWLATRKGFHSQYDYQNALARGRGYKNRAELDKANLLRRGFANPSQYQTYLARQHGFKTKYQYRKWRESQREEDSHLEAVRQLGDGTDRE